VLRQLALAAHGDGARTRNRSRQRRSNPWSAFVDVTETVPELAWPNSINTYSAMRTDAQIASLLLAFTPPIRRCHWYIAMGAELNASWI
jgi:hypothetical protein